MSLFKQKNNSSYSLFVSLKSSSIDIQLVKISSNNKREVLFCNRNILLLENSQDPQLYTKTYIKELDQTLKNNQLQISRLAENKELQVVFVLYTPWFTSHIDSLFFKEQITLNEKFIDAELEKKSETELKLLEKHIIKIETNGYSVTDIEDLVCSNVKIDVYSSFISRETHATLIKTIKQYFPKTKEFLCKTSPMMFTQAINTFMVREDNEVFINITGEITEVGIIEDDALVQFATFPIGIHDFVRATQSNIKSYDYDLLYQKEITIKSAKDTARFEQLKQDWINSLTQTLTYSKQHIPNKVLILGHYKTLEFFSTLLKNVPLLTNHRIITFDNSLLKDIIVYKTPLGDNELDLKLEALI